MQRLSLLRITAVALVAFAMSAARADALVDWNVRAGQILSDARLGTPVAIRTMALVQTATLAALEALDRQRPHGARAVSSVAVEAAIAAAHRTVLLKLVPSQKAAIDAAYEAAVAALPDGAHRRGGIAAAERAAAMVLTARANDLPGAVDNYRPHTTAGAYVPTVTPAAYGWTQRKPWLMARADQFRPAPPPSLDSKAWERDYNEVKSLGAKASTARSAEQTEIARFWEYSLPPIYFGVVRSVAQMPGRDVERNARLYAAAAQAMDDAMVAVFDAKYHHAFWRPVTAIRNGDTDGRDDTMRDATWTPLIEAPMHPEYPSGHAILAAAVGTVLKADLGDSPGPELSTSSPTAGGATRRWQTIDQFVREVAESRVLAGIHFRTAVEVGMAMGEQIGGLAAQRLLSEPH